MTLLIDSLKFLFEKNNDFDIPVKISSKKIKYITELRNKKIITPAPNIIKINNHSELSITIPIQKKLTLKKLIKNIDQKIFVDKSNNIKIQPVTNSIDIYKIFEEDNCSQRLRLRFDKTNNLFLSVIIISNINTDKFKKWQNPEFSVIVRPEDIYAFNENIKNDSISQKEYITSIKKDIIDFLYSGEKGISHIIFKKTSKGKFNQNNNGGLKKCFYKKNNKIIDATKTLGAVKINPFVSFTIEETNKILLPSQMDIKKNQILIEKIIDNPLLLEKYIKDISGVKTPTKQKVLKIEIEAQGKKNANTATNIAKQLLGTDGLLQKLKIDYSLHNSRNSIIE